MTARSRMGPTPPKASRTPGHAAQPGDDPTPRDQPPLSRVAHGRHECARQAGDAWTRHAVADIAAAPADGPAEERAEHSVLTLPDTVATHPAYRLHPALLDAGLRYAFPKAAAREETPRLGALHDAVAARPRIAAYLASGRRVPFNESDIFRRYPELDG